MNSPSEAQPHDPLLLLPRPALRPRRRKGGAPEEWTSRKSGAPGEVWVEQGLLATRPRRGLRLRSHC
eukprot:8952303-Alexandrium_andersonii.AAC.1